MGRVAVKNWPIGWTEDPSFHLPAEKGEELAEILELDPASEKAQEMLQTVRFHLSMYPSIPL